MRPQDAVAAVECLAPLLELLDQLGVDGESVGERQKLFVEHVQPVAGHGRLDLR